MRFAAFIVTFVLDKVYVIKREESIAKKGRIYGIDESTVPAEQAEAVIVDLTGIVNSAPKNFHQLPAYDRTFSSERS